MIRFPLPVRRLVFAAAVTAFVPACGEREPPPPPSVDAAPVSLPAETAAPRPDTLEGDSVMARDTLWVPQP